MKYIRNISILYEKGIKKEKKYIIFILNLIILTDFNNI